MNFASLFGQLSFLSGSKNQLSIVIQADAVYIAAGSGGAVISVPIETGWETSLAKALNSVPSSRYSASVVFSAKYYQSFQVDKPDLPRDEWASGLPFLLKDLVSEKVTDIVADAYPLPDSRRVQAYVLSKSLLNPLVRILTKMNVTLKRVLPEEEVWSQVQTEHSNFIILYRCIKDNYQVSAFTEKVNRFKRVIRGVVPPLTGVATSELQLDSIALELQRSTDYLSSQLRSTPINHLYVQCDEEDSEELVKALSERLSVKVAQLTEDSDINCGQLLCRTASRLSDDGINLYPEHIRPKREILTLKTALASWLILVLAMAGYYAYLTAELSNIKQDLQALQSEREQLSTQVTKLSEEVADLKPTPSKVAAAERMRADIEAKKATLKTISQYDESLKQGYSGVMNALAKIDRNDISVSQIELNGSILNLKGLAATPNSVPKWVGLFRTELDLVGRTFEQLNIYRDQNDVVNFELTTRVATESQPGEGK